MNTETEIEKEPFASL